MIALFDSSRLNIGDLLYDETPSCVLPIGYRDTTTLTLGGLPSSALMEALLVHTTEILGGFD